MWLGYKTKTLKNKDGPASTNCNDTVHIPSENQIKASIVYFYHINSTLRFLIKDLR